jgi:succinyl-CoA synthetase alpha subunit
MTIETAFRVFPNLYRDSVALMQLGATLRERAGIAEASCIMATPANLAQLAHAKLSVDVAAHPSDLLVVVRGERAACADALDTAHALLHAGAAPAGERPGDFALALTSIAAAVEHAPDVDLALISVPGEYAAAEAMKALSLGVHVMLFSDNVDVADERAIKQAAAERGLLVMGPDCGTAIVNGIPLGFANVVRRGDIGLVAASGTGLQEVTCRIHHLGGGVSQALGTGGRDLRDDVGGLTMQAGVRALAQDARTRVVVLISKPPSPAIAARVLALAAESDKPTVVHFLGAAPDTLRAGRLHAVRSLAEAADVAVALAGGAAAPAGDDAGGGKLLVQASLDGFAPQQRVVRGLFTGGTFCYEAQLAFVRRGLACRSNAPVDGAQPLEAAGGGHVLIDMGDDDYTRGRPHPMIDPALRNAAIREAAHDPATAILLFDVVLGYGAHASPADALADALRDAQRTAALQGRRLLAIGHVCGTEDDPQDRAAQLRTLASAGALVAGSNFEAATLAAELARRLAGTHAASAR